MTDKLSETIQIETIGAKDAAINGIEHIESACRQLRIILPAGGLRAGQRVQLFQEIQNGLGLVITAVARLGVIEDLRPAMAPPPRTKESLTQAVQAAAMELTKYTEDSEGDTSGDEDLQHIDRKLTKYNLGDFPLQDHILQQLRNGRSV